MGNSIHVQRYVLHGNGHITRWKQNISKGISHLGMPNIRSCRKSLLTEPPQTFYNQRNNCIFRSSEHILYTPTSSSGTFVSDKQVEETVVFESFLPLYLHSIFVLWPLLSLLYTPGPFSSWPGVYNCHSQDGC